MARIRACFSIARRFYANPGTLCVTGLPFFFFSEDEREVTSSTSTSSMSVRSGSWLGFFSGSPALRIWTEPKRRDNKLRDTYSTKSATAMIATTIVMATADVMRGFPEFESVAPSSSPPVSAEDAEATSS